MRTAVPGLVFLHSAKIHAVLLYQLDTGSDREIAQRGHWVLYLLFRRQFMKVFQVWMVSQAIVASGVIALHDSFHFVDFEYVGTQTVPGIQFDQLVNEIPCIIIGYSPTTSQLAPLDFQKGQKGTGGPEGRFSSMQDVGDCSKGPQTALWCRV